MTIEMEEVARRAPRTDCDLLMEVVLITRTVIPAARTRIIGPPDCQLTTTCGTGERSRNRSPACCGYFLVIFQMTPVPGICTRGPSPVPARSGREATLNFARGSLWPKSRTAP